jgi:hypothetical protein
MSDLAWIAEHKEIYIVSFFLITTATCIIYFTNNIGKFCVNQEYQFMAIAV